MSSKPGFASAVRAETLAPATRGPSEELEALEESVKRFAAFMDSLEPGKFGALEQVGNEVLGYIGTQGATLDRLRAALATAEEENAELRRLCGRAIRHVILPAVPVGEAEQFEQLVRDLTEAAARRAGK